LAEVVDFSVFVFDTYLFLLHLPKLYWQPRLTLQWSSDVPHWPFLSQHWLSGHIFKGPHLPSVLMYEDF